MIGRGSFRLPQPHPLPRKRSPSLGREWVTENYHDRVSFPGGVPALNPLRSRRRITHSRGARGDSSRYSLLMGVLFSGALGPPGRVTRG